MGLDSDQEPQGYGFISAAAVCEPREPMRPRGRERSKEGKHELAGPLKKPRLCSQAGKFPVTWEPEVL